MNSNDVMLVGRAAALAGRKHAGKLRDGDPPQPYDTHLVEVVGLLSRTERCGAVLLAAGWLHDTLEDTETTSEELERLFGIEVARIVGEVTDDDTSLPSEVRKRIQAEKAPSMSVEARLIKIADNTSNVRGLASSGRTIDRRRGYIASAEKVVDACRGVDPALERAFDAARDDALKAIKTA